MPDTNTTSTQFIRMFENLFEIIRDSTKSINTLISEVGKERAGVNEFIQLVRDRPCFEKQVQTHLQEIREKSIASIETLQNTYEKEIAENKEMFIKKLGEIQDDDNKRLVKFLYIMLAANVVTLLVLVVFISFNPQVWSLLEKFIAK